MDIKDVIKGYKEGTISKAEIREMMDELNKDLERSKNNTERLNQRRHDLEIEIRVWKEALQLHEEHSGDYSKYHKGNSYNWKVIKNDFSKEIEEISSAKYLDPTDKARQFYMLHRDDLFFGDEHDKAVETIRRALFR